MVIIRGSEGSDKSFAEPTILQCAYSRAAESESRSELESIGVDIFGWSLSRSWSRQNSADSDSCPESQDTALQQTMILTERLCIVSKTLKDRKKRRVAVSR